MGTTKQPTFADDLQQAVESSVLAFVRKGDWLAMDYGKRISFSTERLREVYEAIDWARVRALCAERVEGHLADAIFNSMATEIGHDVKQILSNRELREDVRALLREKIRDAHASLAKGGTQ